MSSNLRVRAINDMKKQSLKNWSTKLILQDPAGNTYDKDNETGEELRSIQTLYDRRKEDPDTGEIIMVHEPVITIALSSLSRVPKSGEKWSVKFPLDPTDESVLSNYALSGDRAVEGGASLGFIRIYPLRLEQL